MEELYSFWCQDYYFSALLKGGFSQPYQSCWYIKDCLVLPGFLKPLLNFLNRYCSFAIHQIHSPPAPLPITMQLGKRVRKSTPRGRVAKKPCNAPRTAESPKAPPAGAAAPQPCAEVAAVASVSEPSVAAKKVIVTTCCPIGDRRAVLRG